MSKKLIYLISFVLVLNLVLANAANAQTGLVGRWKFDGDANDSSGYGRHGEPNGSPLPEYIAGVTYGDDLPFYADNNAIYFTTPTDQQYVSLPVGPLVQSLTGGSTFTLWVNYRPPDGGNRWERIFDFGDAPSTAPTNYMALLPRRSSSAPPHFEITTGGTTERVSWGPYSNDGTFIPTFRWLHLAITISEPNEGVRLWRMYADGVPVGDNNEATHYPGELGDTAYNWVARSLDTDVDGLYLRQCYLDDFRIYNKELSQTEVRQAMGYPVATFPSPGDGTAAPSATQGTSLATLPLGTTDVNLSWIRGAYAADVNGHHVYVGTSWKDVDDGNAVTDMGLTSDTTYHLSGLAGGPIYYWRIDEVNSPGNVTKGLIWSFRITPSSAWEPTPVDGATLVPPNMTLRWRAGAGAVTRHDVYFGTTINPPFRVSIPLPTPDPCWTPVRSGIPVTYNTTYYWRINEVNDPCVYEGDVWSFTTVPKAPPASDPNLVGWWKLNGDANDSAYGCDGTLIGTPGYTEGFFDQALYFGNANNAELADDNYVSLPIDYVISTLTNSTFMVWVNWSAVNGRDERFFTFGTAQNNHLHLGPEVSNSPPTHLEIVTPEDSSMVGYGANAGNAGSYVPTDEWHNIAVTIDADANVFTLYLDGDQVGENLAAELTPSDLGVTTQNWLARSTNPLSQRPYTGYLDDLRIYNRALTQPEIVWRITPLQSWRPSPTNNATDVQGNPTLTWKRGFYADKHDVYFGTDFNDVNNASRAYDPCSLLLDANEPNTFYRPGKYKLLQLNKTYYWRVDEVNAPPSTKVYKGNIWNFTTGNYFSVDNFESYEPNNNPPIGNVWKADGKAKVKVTDYPVNPGGVRAMAIDYNNIALPYYSEADTNSTGPNSLDLDFNTNWLAEGVKALSLYFLGYPDVRGSVIWTLETPPLGPYSATISGGTSFLRDIGPTSDEFYYVYRKLTDMGSITAKVVDMGGSTDTLARAGVMFRNSLDPGSKFVDAVVTLGSGIHFQRREEPNGTMTNTTLSGPAAPYWVRLTRYWDSSDIYYIYAEHSPDGLVWTQIGPEVDTTLSLGWEYEMYIGLCVCSHRYGVMCDVNFSDVKFGDLDEEYSVLTDTWESKDVNIPYSAPEPIYVTLQDNDSNATWYYPGTDNPNYADANATQLTTVSDTSTWDALVEWNIDLNDFYVRGVDLDKVQRMYIGVGDRAAPGGGSGIVYFDDVRLYQPRFISDKLPRIPADFVYDGVINEEDLDTLFGSWLQVPTDPNINLYDPNTIDFRDFAEFGKYWYERQVWPTW